jgi:hypothetical protein
MITCKASLPLDIQLFNSLPLRGRNFPLTNISSKFLDMTLTEWVNVILSHPLNMSRMKMVVYRLWDMPTFSTTQQNLPAKNLLWKMNISLSHNITLTAFSVEEDTKNSHSAKRLLYNSLQWITHAFEKSFPWTNNWHCFVQWTSCLLIYTDG